MQGSKVLGIVFVVASALGACGVDGQATVAVERSADAATPVEAPADPTTTAAPTTTAPVPAPPPDPAPAPTTVPDPPRPERVVTDTGFTPFAVVGPVVLHHPVAPTERIGFHQSGHDGAQQLAPVETTASHFVMEDRNRGTGDATAADLVVQPGAEVRAPVTGTVIRGGSYTLYCDHVDEYVVIEPDGRPGWEVKLLHFEGLRVATGERVEAGVTVMGATARILPFESQVDEFTAVPAWPHVHVEVVDPSIPDRPSPGGGCS